MINKRLVISMVIIATAIAVAGIGWINYIQLVETFGDGPPYYGRSTNMDKWSNPVPFLAVIDLTGIIVLAFLARRLRIFLQQDKTNHRD